MFEAAQREWMCERNGNSLSAQRAEVAELSMLYEKTLKQNEFKIDPDLLPKTTSLCICIKIIILAYYICFFWANTSMLPCYGSFDENCDCESGEDTLNTKTQPIETNRRLQKCLDDSHEANFLRLFRFFATQISLPQFHS